MRMSRFKKRETYTTAMATLPVPMSQTMAERKPIAGSNAHGSVRINRQYSKGVQKMIRDDYRKKCKGSGGLGEEYYLANVTLSGKESTGESDAGESTGDSDATALYKTKEKTDAGESTGEWDATQKTSTQKRKPTPLPAAALKKAKTYQPRENIFQPALVKMTSTLTNLVMKTSPQNLEAKLEHTMLKEMQTLNACLHATLQKQRAEYEADYDKDLTRYIQDAKEEGANDIEAELKKHYEAARQLNELNSVAKDKKIKELENEIATSKVRSGEDLKMAESMTGIAEGLKTRLANSEEKAREMLSHFEEAQKMLQQILKEVAEGSRRARENHAVSMKEKDGKIFDMELQMSTARAEHGVAQSKILDLEAQMSSARVEHGVKQNLKDKEITELLEKLATATAQNDRTKKDVERDRAFYEGEITKLKEKIKQAEVLANNRTTWVRKLQTDLEVQKLANAKITEQMHTLTKDKDAIKVANFTLRKQVFLCCG